jgi:hypothetical protein
MVALDPKFRERTEKRCSCVTRPIKGGEGWGAGYRSRGRILVRRLHAAEEQLERLAGVGGFESILGNHWRFVVESARGSCAAEHARAVYPPFFFCGIPSKDGSTRQFIYYHKSV